MIIITSPELAPGNGISGFLNFKKFDGAAVAVVLFLLLLLLLFFVLLFLRSPLLWLLLFSLLLLLFFLLLFLLSPLLWLLWWLLCLPSSLCRSGAGAVERAEEVRGVGTEGVE